MEAIEELKKEHETIKEMLVILKDFVRMLEAGKTVPDRHLKIALEFLNLFTDKCHHGKEESILFPAIEKAGIQREGGPLGVMLGEHETGRKYIVSITEALATPNLKDEEIIALLLKNLNNYVTLLTTHIEKENNILFPMAERVLAPDEDDRLLVEFQKIEHNLIGPGKHEELMTLLKELQMQYTNNYVKNRNPVVPEVAILSKLINYQTGSIVSKTIVNKSAGTVTLFAFDQGESLSEHTAPYDVLIYVLEGKADIGISDQLQHLKSGEIIILPAGQPHTLRAVEKLKLMLVMIKA